MEKEFIDWFEANEKKFAHGQFDEKQIAYSAWLEGRKRALRKFVVNMIMLMIVLINMLVLLHL